MSAELQYKLEESPAYVMTAREARESIRRINAHAANLFSEVKRLYDGKGWEPLGYETFRDCAIAEFKFSQRRIYELLNAAEVSEFFAEFPQKPETEGQLNELAKLRITGSHAYDTAAQKDIWQIAINTAPKSGQGRALVTAAHIRSVIDSVVGIVQDVGLDGERAQTKIQKATTAAHIGADEDGDEWCTPREYVEAARSVMGGIDLDPASSHTAQETVDALAYYTKQDDGLSKEWTGRVWLNPPYSFPLVERFVDKAIQQHAAGKIASAVVLVNASTDGAWFHKLLDRYPVCFTRGRISFYHPRREGQTNRVGQAFFYLGDNSPKFNEVFSRFGSVACKFRLRESFPSQNY